MSARTPRSVLAGLLSLFLVAGAFGGVLAPTAASADTAPLDPTNPATPTTVTADPLPTVQINGVAWSQVVVGTTVYVAGSFTSARPAGAPAGTGEVPRNNLLAYDIRTGELITSFAPSLNAQALAVTASPDGSRIFVGGDFTTANGQPRSRIAAYDTATGQLVSDFRPVFSSQVTALAATGSAVYAGGWFTAVGTTSRQYLAAVAPSNGALLPWNPVPSGGAIGTPAATVMALTVTSGGSQIVVGGRFGFLNGVAATGVGALHATTGATRPFAVNQLITNQGRQSAVYSLTSDGDTVYGTGYVFGVPGNLEGSFAAAANGGALKWVNDCHGDTYSSFPSNGALYMATHAHACSNIGGFPEQNPRVNMFGTAVSLAATGTTGTGTLSNQNLAGKPAPTLLPWAPTFYSGTYTGQFQAGWTVSGNSQYVVYGGEFPGVNGSEQQGLVRFAVPAIAPNKVAPRTTTSWTPVTAMIPGGVRVTWPAVADRDNEYLTYRVYRDSETAAAVCSVVRPSTWWNLPTYTCTDTSATAGAHRYLVTATDAAGNRLASNWVNAVIPASSTGGAQPRSYAATVQADGALDHWSLGEASGATAYDSAGALDLTVNAGVTLGRAGAITGDANTAAQFSGTSTGFLSTRTAIPAPQTFAVEAWFQTTSTAGGKIIGFGNASTGNSGGHDRNVYLDPQGRLNFGVWLGELRSVSGAKAYNDGAWHHVVASLSRNGMQLYVDGQLVGSRTDTTTAQTNTGYWRIGGDTPWVGSGYLNGRIDEVAVYPAPLSGAQVAQHHAVGQAVNTPPTAVFTSSVADLLATVDASGSTDADGRIVTHAWDFGDGSTGTGVTAAHAYALPGTYAIRLTVTDDDGATATVTRNVAVTTPPTGAGSIAADAFGREVTGGLGTADRGGAWTVTGGAANATVTGGSGRLTAAVGATTGAALGVSARDVSVQADVVLDRAPTGGGDWVTIGSRNVDATRYNTQLWFSPTGVVQLSLVTVVDGVETDGAVFTLPGTYTAGSAITVRTEVTGTGTTSLRAKAWTAGTAEPAAWQVSATDTSAALQRPGGLHVDLYHSKSATTPQTLRLDNLQAGAPAGGNTAPTASFTSTVGGATVTVDGSASTDPEGQLASHAWDFGDGTTGSGMTAAHTYTASGTYTVRLTVTDQGGATASVTGTVSVTVPVTPPPAGAPLASDSFGREVTGGFGPADVGGPWSIAGTASNATVTGGSGRLTAPAGRTILAQLGVSGQDVALTTDVSLDRAPTGGGTYVSIGSRNVDATRYKAQLAFAANGSVRLSLMSVVNWVETERAAFVLPGTYTPGTALTVRFEVAGTGSSTLRARVWTKGTTEPADWQVTATDTTAALQRAGGLVVGLYTSGSATAAQTLRVDNLTAQAPGTVVVPPQEPGQNAAPTAAFTSAVSGPAVSVDGSTSTDADGRVASYAWTFGDGGTGTGATASHTYAAAGTYPVRLTVTDDKGATATVTRDVTVTAPVTPPPTGDALATDAFGREVTGGFGPAELGGTWTTHGTAANVAVTGGSGRLTAPAGTSTGAQLDVSGQDVALQADVVLDQAATGGGTYVQLGGRNVGATRYNAQLAFSSNGNVVLSMASVVNWAETSRASFRLPGTYTPGTALTVRFEVVGNGSTTLRAKAWPAGTAEPAAWQVTATDTSAALQRPGGLWLDVYSSGSATRPSAVRIDNLVARPAV